MKKLNSIRLKILIFVPIVIIALSILSIFSYTTAKNSLEEEIHQKMEFLSNDLTHYIDSKLLGHQRLGESMAQVIAEQGQALSRNEINQLSSSLISLNENTYGMGVWFEANQYEDNLTYFGPYTYKEGNQIKFTDEYESESYDYLSNEWYTLAKESNQIIWTEPYYDETLDITMITTSFPFELSNQFSGVITGDMDISELQSTIQHADIGEGTVPFLISDSNHFIVHPDDSLTMSSLTEDKDLINLEENFRANDNGKETLNYLDNSSTVFFQRIPRTNWVLGFIISEEIMFQSLNQLLYRMIGLALIVSVVFILIALYLANQLSKPIKQLNEEVGIVAQGDLSRSIKKKTNDEIGSLTDRFNQMVQQFNALIREVKQSIFEVHDATEQLSAVSEETTASSEEISRAMSQVSQGTTDAAHFAESTNEQTMQLSKKLTTLVNQTKQLDSHATTVTSIQDQGLNQMKILDNGSNESKHVITQVGQDIHNLANQIVEIGAIVSTINDISEQTNLLALNASIEAARAGEHGKGFAIVADEVRKLSEETAGATKRISDTITLIEQAANKAVNQMEESKSITETQVSVVKQSITLFNNLADENNEMIHSIETIGSNIKDIDHYKDNVVTAISEIASILQETAAASEEVDASTVEQLEALKTITEAAETLQQSSELLEKEIKKFKTER